MQHRLHICIHIKESVRLMNRILFFLGLMNLFFLPSPAQAQIYDPVSWDFKSIRMSQDEYDLVFTAEMDKGWSIYSQYLEKEDGPVPTSFNFDEADHYVPVSKNEECDLNRKEVFDKLFSMKLIKFSSKAYFIQKIKVSDPSKEISGFLEFMTCDDTKCLPPTQVDFFFDLSNSLDQKSISYSTEQLCSGSQSFSVIENTGSDHSSVASNTDQNTINNQDEETLYIDRAFDDILNPVTWTGELTLLDNDEYKLKLVADIEQGWHMYSKDIEGDDGPVPTSINFDFNGSYSAKGALVETAKIMVEEYDPYFSMDLTKLKKQAVYEQLFTASNIDAPLEGYLEFMVCDASKCLPPEPMDFRIFPAEGKVEFGVFVEGGDGGGTATSSDQRMEEMYGLNVDALQEPLGTCFEQKEEKKTLWGIFLLGIIGGMVALLTPCVFPMIPLTVSFFTKGAEKGKGMINALVYGGSIFLIYVLLSVPFHLMDAVDPNILNNISTNVWLNIFFFAIFVFFAFSFFGYYELTLPSGFTNRVSTAEGIGGLIGVFFMALTLALVSFSCTGPILGSLLAGTLSSDGGALQLTSGMAGFGLALALPFGLFAAFPSLMNKLPKSGGWLNTVKVVLGFVELALAFKFLSNADLVKQWGLLKIEPFLIIWFLCALGLTLYLFGKIRFPHDSPLKRISLPRAGFGILSLLLAVYLLTGFRYSEKAGTYKSLTMLSGLAPPVCYSWIYNCKCPQGLECFKDLEEGLAHAKAVNKPVMLDFTGHACVNCREMEENVWPEPEVYPYLKNDYVLISLYVDEKISLPEDQQITIERKSGGKKKLRYTGDRWQLLQTEYFNKNTQPLYVLMTPDGQLLNNPVAFTPDKNDYARFLECGLENFGRTSMQVPDVQNNTSSHLY